MDINVSKNNYCCLLVSLLFSAVIHGLVRMIVEKSVWWIFRPQFFLLSNKRKLMSNNSLRSISKLKGIFNIFNIILSKCFMTICVRAKGLKSFIVVTLQLIKQAASPSNQDDRKTRAQVNSPRACL